MPVLEEDVIDRENLIWAATKLVEMRSKYGNSGFTTDDLERLHVILGNDGFMKTSEKKQTSGCGVWCSCDNCMP